MKFDLFPNFLLIDFIGLEIRENVWCVLARLACSHVPFLSFFTHPLLLHAHVLTYLHGTTQLSKDHFSWDIPKFAYFFFSGVTASAHWINFLSKMAKKTENVLFCLAVCLNLYLTFKRKSGLVELYILMEKFFDFILPQWKEKLYIQKSTMKPSILKWFNKVHIFWEGHKLQFCEIFTLLLTDLLYIGSGQK